MVLVAEDRKTALNLEAIFGIKWYSSKLKLLQVTGTVLKFINLLKSKETTEPLLLLLFCFTVSSTEEELLQCPTTQGVEW